MINRNQGGLNGTPCIIFETFIQSFIHYRSLTPPPYRWFYVIHATRALQSHDLSGEGINSGSHTYFFDHTRTWRASPDEGTAQCRGHLRDNANMKDDSHHSRTPFILTRWIWKDDYDGQIIFRDLVSLKLPDICLTGEKPPQKKTPRKLVLTGDRTLAHCVTGVHATGCSTAVDCRFNLIA